MLHLLEKNGGNQFRVIGSVPYLLSSFFLSFFLFFFLLAFRIPSLVLILIFNFSFSFYLVGVLR